MIEELKQNGYQPSKTDIKNPIPPSTGSNVKAKKNGYTWEDVDKAWWEGFDYCKEKLEKQILVWHDLRKDPNDLPNDDRDVIVKRESELESQIDNYYDDDIGAGWGRMIREGYSTDDVIAWCEIPQFKE